MPVSKVRVNMTFYISSFAVFFINDKTKISVRIHLKAQSERCGGCLTLTTC